MRSNGKFPAANARPDDASRETEEPRGQLLWWSVPERAETGGSMLKVAAVWFGCFVLVIAAVAIFG